MQFLGFIGIVLAGGILMAFMLELLNTERRGMEKAERMEVGPVVQSAATLPAFFGKPRVAAHMLDSKELGDALIAVLEEHVRNEQAIVSGFVHLPSFASLYRQTGSSQTMN